MPYYDRTTALIVVDVQNDFATAAGSLSVRGGEEVVAVINAEVEAALGAGARVFYTQDWHPPRTPHFEPDGGPWPVHCVGETWGAQFHPALTVSGEVVRKGAGTEDGYSGFTTRDHESCDQSATLLEGLLRERGVERVIVVGLATDYCVQATALDAIARGFETSVLLDAVAGRSGVLCLLFDGIDAECWTTGWASWARTARRRPHAGFSDDTGVARVPRAIADQTLGASDKLKAKDDAFRRGARRSAPVPRSRQAHGLRQV